MTSYVLGMKCDQWQTFPTYSDLFDDQSNLSLDLGVGDAVLNAAKGRSVRMSSEVHSIVPIE